jgi:hypothetical protein
VEVLHQFLATAMLGRMPGYTRGTSSEAFLLGDCRERRRDTPVMSDDARALPLAIAVRKDGFEVAPDAPFWLFLPAV